MYTKGIHKEGEDLEMNTLVIVLIAAVLLTFLMYTFCIHEAL